MDILHSVEGTFLLIATTLGLFRDFAHIAASGVPILGSNLV